MQISTFILRKWQTLLTAHIILYYSKGYPNWHRFEARSFIHIIRQFEGKGCEVIKVEKNGFEDIKH